MSFVLDEGLRRCSIFRRVADESQMGHSKLRMYFHLYSNSVNRHRRTCQPASARLPLLVFTLSCLLRRDVFERLGTDHAHFGRIRWLRRDPSRHTALRYPRKLPLPSKISQVPRLSCLLARRHDQTQRPGRWS